jgi:hypothetical protein
MEIVPFAGWSRNLRLANPSVELIVSLEVGPRILRFARPGGPNPFKEYTEQQGKTGETEWMIRGGHRLWVAPEAPYSYALDNSPVPFTEKGPRHVLVQPADDPACGWKKELEIILHDSAPRATIVHRLTHTGSQPVEIAPWALTVMAAGGTAILPQPPKGTHPENLLPDRPFVFWPYTDLSDPRYTWGPPYLTVRQDAQGKPTKFGQLHTCGWAGYAVHGLLFAKTVPLVEGARYPDYGVNFELFTNHEMLELETLAPLVSFAPGQTLEHTEHWALLDAPASLDAGTDRLVRAGLGL